MEESDKMANEIFDAIKMLETEKGIPADVLMERIRSGKVREVIIAISTSVEGETTLFYLMNLLRQYPEVRITNIARGIGFGDELEYVDEQTITHALANRRPIE